MNGSGLDHYIALSVQVSHTNGIGRGPQGDLYVQATVHK